MLLESALPCVSMFELIVVAVDEADAARGGIIDNRDAPSSRRRDEDHKSGLRKLIESRIKWKRRGWLRRRARLLEAADVL